jgi:WD40 repeat protein
VRLWDAGRTQSWANSAPTITIDFNHDGRSIAAASTDGDVRVWDPATGTLQAHLNGPGQAYAGSFSPIENSVLIADVTPRLVLWPISAKAATVVVQAPAGRGIVSAAFDGSGRRIVYADTKGAVVVRDLGSGHETRLTGAPETPYGARLSPDAKYVVGATAGNPVVWRVDQPSKPISELKGHHGPVNEITIGTHDRIVTAGADGTVRTWDPTGKELSVMRGNEDEVTTAIFTTDGTQVLSSGLDGTLRLYDARSGRQLVVLQLRDQLFDVAQADDGRVGTLGSDKVIRVFPCDFCGSLDHVRAVALSRPPRELTASERKQYLSAAG